MKFTLRDNFYEPLKSLSNEELGILLRATFSYLRGEEVKIPNELLTAWGYLYAQINIEVLKDKKTSQSRAQAGRRGMAKRWGNSKKASSSYNKENNCYEATESQAFTKKEEEITNKNNNSNETSNNQALTMAKKMDNKDNVCYKHNENQIVREKDSVKEAKKSTSFNNYNNNLNKQLLKEKEIKEKEKKKREEFRPPTIEDIRQHIKEQGYEYTDPEAWFNFYESKGWFVGKNKMKNWKAAVKTWELRGKGNATRKGKTTPSSEIGRNLKKDNSKYDKMNTW